MPDCFCRNILRKQKCIQHRDRFARNTATNWKLFWDWGWIFWNWITNRKRSANRNNSSDRNVFCIRCFSFFSFWGFRNWYRYTGWLGNYKIWSWCRTSWRILSLPEYPHQYKLFWIWWISFIRIRSIFRCSTFASERWWFIFRILHRWHFSRWQNRSINNVLLQECFHESCINRYWT